MNVKVININKDYEGILPFLFPTYSISESPALTSNFITHRDIKSKMEREALDIRYDNCVFISSQIFDEFWDEEVIKREVVLWTRKKFKSRKSKLDLSPSTLVQDCINFMFDLSSEEDEVAINELFESFGSNTFVKKFLELSNRIPLPVLTSSVYTFITKILSGSESSIFYKKKSILFKSKIEENLIKAIDDFTVRDQDSYGLSQVKFFCDTFE